MPHQYPKLGPNKGGPLHYLGNRFLDHPNHSGHMKVDTTLLRELISIIASTHPQEKKYRRCYEPFAGSASWSLAAMELGLGEEYVINDSNTALINTHLLMRDEPETIKEEYAKLAKAFALSPSKKEFFADCINHFNQAPLRQKSLLLPFIINHSWGGILFHDAKANLLIHEWSFGGKTSPAYLENATLSPNDFFAEVDRVSKLFNSNKVHFLSGDFELAVKDLQANDFVALNPPYPENERSLSEKTGMYLELYSPDELHKKLLHLIQQMDSKGVEYVMTYGFYNPDMKRFVIRDQNNQLRNYLQIIGETDCAFGQALNQIYFSPRYTLPLELSHKIIPAHQVLQNQELKPEQAFENYRRIAAGI